jgi:hypothetical protein
MHTNPRWVNYGDAPLVYATKFSISTSNVVYFAQYQFGINDFPYYQTRIGLDLVLRKLTPKYTDIPQATSAND